MKLCDVKCYGNFAGPLVGVYFGAQTCMVRVSGASLEVFVWIVPKRKVRNERGANTALLYKEMRKKGIQRTRYAV